MHDKIVCPFQSRGHPLACLLCEANSCLSGKIWGSKQVCVTVLQHALKLSESEPLSNYSCIWLSNLKIHYWKPPASIQVSIVKIKSGLLHSLLQIPSFLTRLWILFVSGNFVLLNPWCLYENNEAGFLSGLSWTVFLYDMEYFKLVRRRERWLSKGLRGGGEKVSRFLCALPVTQLGKMLLLVAP